MALFYTYIKPYENNNNMNAKKIIITDKLTNIYNDLPNEWKTSITNDILVCHNHGKPICELGDFYKS